MRNAKRIVLVAVVVWVVLVAVCSAGSGRMTTKEKRTKAMKLLDKYTETQGKLKS